MKNMSIIKAGQLIAALLISCCPPISLCHADSHIHRERYYQERWCAARQGQAEYRLPDGTRVDCLTRTHAIEVDFAEKWAESIGQALYYALKTSKKPGVALIMERPVKDQRYLERLRAVAGQAGIETWIIRP